MSDTTDRQPQPPADSAAGPPADPSAVQQSTDRTRPDPAHDFTGVDDRVVDALGKASEALETVEHARGHLYAWHQLSGRADLQLGDAVTMLRDAGQSDLADHLERDLVGRNVLEGRWTYQVVEEYDDGYYDTFKQAEQDLRRALAGGRRHLFEARMKEQERTRGRRHHEAVPADDQ